MKKSVPTLLVSIALSAFLVPEKIAHRTSSVSAAPVTAISAPASDDRVALYQALLDLQNPWTVMCVAAHPDDEDGTSLIVMRRKFGVHTVSLFSTFGEGGQNAIGPELYEELGAIRARETMAAAEIQGSEPHFLGLKDFGFSKSADEAFKVWGHDEALRRMVQQIRQLRPDVIITNHDTTSGHGHHQATGRLVLEAFDAAADPQRFPEQLKDGVTTWQVQRLFVRFGFGQAAAQTDTANVVTIDPNEMDPVRGISFAEQALHGLQQHATQGPWPKSMAEMAQRFRNSPDGKLPLIRYRLVREAKGAASLPADSHYLVAGLQLPESAAKQLTAPNIEGRSLTEFADDRPRVLNQLLIAQKNHIFGDASGSQTRTMIAPNERSVRMQQRLNVAIAAAAGITAKVTPRAAALVPGQVTALECSIANGGGHPVRIGAVNSGAGVRSTSLATNHFVSSTIAAGQTLNVSLKFEAPLKTGLTVPHAQHLYDQGFAGMAVGCGGEVEIEGAQFPVWATALMDVAPPVEIAEFKPSLLVARPDSVGVSSAGADIIPARPSAFTLVLINHQQRPFAGEVAFVSEADKKETKQTVQLQPDERKTVTISVPNPAQQSASAHSRSVSPTDWASLVVRASGSRVSVSARRLPVIWSAARVAPRLRVGYIRGFDFSLPDALNALGVESKELSVADVRSQDLSQYGTVIVDNRVYESQPELIAVNQRLLEYASAGGTLLVFYHKSDEWNPSQRANRPQLAPYPLTLGNERVTYEDAPVTFLEPQHPLMNYPNKIDQSDFDGWIQERGLYYPREWDAHYTALFAMNDPGEKPLRGGLLVTDYGKGHYIYTSMVWYRQLRGGIAGGYRMFANMISYGHQ